MGSLQQAQARLSAAKSGLNLAAYNMENSIVRAPFDGIVLEVSAEVGEYVSAGHVVVRLLDIALIAIVGWILLVIARVIEKGALAKFPATSLEDRRSRRPRAGRWKWTSAATAGA